jgi:hypothetical protein
MGRLVPGIPPSAGRLEREGQALDGAWKRETGRRRGRRSARRKGESAVERPVRDPEEKRKTRLLPPPEGRQDALVVVG